MFWYYFIFIWIGIMAWLSKIIKMTTIQTVQNNRVERINLIAAIITFLPVFLLVVLENPANDLPSYLHTFRTMPTSFSGLEKVLSESKSEHGILILDFILKNLFGNDDMVFRVCIACIHSIPVLFVFRKYSENYWLSIYLFVANACHIAWMMNGIRQFIAVSIIMVATPWLIEKKFVRVVIIILFAMWFHTSAVFMLPIVFIVHGKAWNKKTLLFIFAAIIGMYIFSTYTNVFDSLLVNTEYSNSIVELRLGGDTGINPIRMLVSAVPVVLSILGRKAINDDNDSFMNICVNMSVVTFGTNLIAMVTSGILTGRLPIYTALYSFIFLPYLVRKVFNEKFYHFVYAVMIVLYFIYFLVELKVI